MRKPLNKLLVCLIPVLLYFKLTQAFETVTDTDTSPNNVSSGLAGKTMRHYAVPPYTGSSQPQLYAVQPQYPQYYFGPQPQNPCLLPQQVGTGPYRIPRWYFNPARQACELFYWSGCCGNSNNFQTYHDCQKRCEGGNAAKPNTVVFVPFTLTFTMKPTGNTNLQPLPTAQTASCQPGDCQKGHIAGSGTPLFPITPKAEPRFIPVTPSSPHLPPPVPTAQLRPIPVIVTVCDFELDSGVGSMEIIRYYYNKRNRVCEEFRYRGQGGNRNNFLSLPECRKVCPESPSPCAYGELTPANQPLQCQPGSTVAQTCGGEQFCHIGASPQTTVCCPKPADLDPCGQPMSAGVGNANLQRWYFNSMAQQCQPLQYRGLQGNENNFLTQNACQVQCQVNPCRVGIPFRNTNGVLAYCAANDASECPTGYYCHIGANAQTSVCCQALEINPCKEPKVEGEGLARQVRYYFDVERKECLPFEYKGIKGNPNNFVSKTACERRCPVWVNPCAKGQPILDVTNKPELCHLGRPCPQNYYCHIGFNDETTVCCPASSTNPCTVPINYGMGYHIINRWYYNSATRQCERFVYKGSHGNENNFLVRDQCEATCPSFPNPCPTGDPLFDEKGVLPRLCNPQEESSCPATYFCHFGQTNTTRVCCPGRVDPCLLARSKGEGAYAETRWYFDISLKQCLPFEFFGMKGNGNNFSTKENCEKTCPVFANPCPDSFTMNVLGVQYHSNTHYQKCDVDTRDSCPLNHWCHVGNDSETTLCCPNAGDPCSYPPRTAGVGKTRLERWTYNPHSVRCEPFIYLGQKGNQNNFLSHEDCSKKCINRRVHIASTPHEAQRFENPCSSGFPLVSAQNEILQCMESRPCPPGYFCHVGSNDIETVCCPAIGSDPCGQPLDSGTGGARLQRWFWNAQAGCCQPFNYCGLRGTQNNFLTREDCEQTCMEFENPCIGQPEMLSFNKPKLCGMFNACSPSYWCHLGAIPQTTVCCPNRVSAEEVCRLPVAYGRGNEKLRRWYYDTRRGCCVMFTYYGKYGNQNNFLTLQDCQKACVGNDVKAYTDTTNYELTPSFSAVPFYHNHCPDHEPLLEKLITENGTTLAIRPIKCTFENEEDVCGEHYWCFLGVATDENMCCPGGSRRKTACAGKAELNDGTSYGDAKTTLRWTYDIKTNECFAFRFKGSRGNQNNFLTKEECITMCRVVNPCKLPIPLPLEQCVPGPNACAARPNMYCHVGAVPQTTVCCPAETPNPCELPVDPGAGRDRLERWFYNAQTSICQPFTYNGIKGNQNNFLSQQDCEELCVPNPCAEGRPFVGADGRPQTCSPSASMNTCPANHWCHVGATQLTTVCCPAARPNPCTLPMSTGEGDASLERFYFDQSTKTCKPFEYRGLKGNQNNFLSQRSCQLACQPLDNPCIGQPATTPTGQVLFCSSTNKDTCPVNFWCHLGATPETTVCCPGATNPCSVPLAPGTGNSGLSRWYYNTDERQCVPFQYNGKRGNQNNFLSQNECERTCPEQLCLLSIDKGACSGRQTRFAFNRQTSQCVPFEYTGCGGNLNNFLTMEDCVATCGNVGF